MIPGLQYHPGYYCPPDAESLFQQFISNHQWPDNHYEVAGRRFALPRQQTWHADEGIVYRYSNNLLETRPWTPLLSAIREKLEQSFGREFNAVLVNHYRNGDDYVGWHADDEAELGAEPYIASISFGATRAFSCKAQAGEESRSLDLGSGDLVLMTPEFQQRWLHAVMPAPGLTEARVNLTFRYVLRQ